MVAGKDKKRKQGLMRGDAPPSSLGRWFWNALTGPWWCRAAQWGEGWCVVHVGEGQRCGREGGLAEAAPLR